MIAEKKPDGRRERSRQTRRRIVDAATDLFLARGYVNATIEDVAAEADVSVQTVYYVFGTKPQLLAAVLDASIAGDVEPVAIAARPWVESIRSAPDARAAIDLLVESSVGVIARVAPMYEVVRRAAADPEVDGLLTETRRRRRDDQRMLIEIIAQSGHLPAAVTIESAADSLYGLVNEEVFQLLTDDCSWTVDQFRNWVSVVLTHLLLGEQAPHR